MQSHATRTDQATNAKVRTYLLCIEDLRTFREGRGYLTQDCRLARFKRGGIDLVLTDLIMPGLDGAKLIEAIKSISPRTPAILLSGKVRIYDRDTQADVFLPKGMHVPAELLERIRLLLIRKRGPTRTQLRPHEEPRQVGVA